MSPVFRLPVGEEDHLRLEKIAVNGKLQPSALSCHQLPGDAQSQTAAYGRALVRLASAVIAIPNMRQILFRDSFGSSLAPLLVQGYKTVTLVDIRYLASGLLGRFIDFHGQDVLFLYSTSLCNRGMLLK